MGPVLAALLLAQATSAGSSALPPDGSSPMGGAAVAPVSRPNLHPGEQPVDPYVVSDANAGGEPLAGAAVFKAFHGRAGVGRVADDFVERSFRDSRIKDIFAAADETRLKRTLAEQICYLLDGGCSYSGRDMATAHKGMGLQNADFNAVVENLQKAMDDEHVPFRDQNVLLAKLAPMQRTVVERKSPTMLKEIRRQLASLTPHP